MTAISQENSNILQCLIYVHQGYQILAPRFNYFRAMNAVWPECSSRIMDLKQEDPNNKMFREEEFVILVYLLFIYLFAIAIASF